MRRDFGRLDQGPFDLLVIGGGIYGSWIAYDAALRGLTVALVEKEDWAAGTSSASTKLIHGGLRYLEQFRLGLVRRSLEERRRLAELGPHRVRPLRFVLPVYRGDRVGRVRLRAGLWLYDRLAGARSPVGPHQALDRAKILKRCPYLRTTDLEGGFSFGDCQMDDARFALEIVDGADGAGAVAVNRASVRSLIMEGRRGIGAVVRDEETGAALEVRAGVTACCTGVASNGLIEAIDPRAPLAVRITKGAHLVMPALPSSDALLVTSRRKGQVVFLIPWYGRTLLGTTDTDYRGSPSDVQVEAADVDYLLDEAARALGDRAWTENDVVSRFAGLRVLRAADSRSPAALSREFSLEEPLERVLVPVGGKYTSARLDAALVVDRVLERLGRPAQTCPTTSRKFPWTPIPAYDAWSHDALIRGLDLGLDEPTARLCPTRYGSRVERVHELIRTDPELARRIVSEAPFCRAEILYAVTHEMARTLDDVLRRRMPLLLLCRMSEEQLRDAATLAGRALGWSDERMQREIDALARRPSAARPAHETV